MFIRRITQKIRKHKHTGVLCTISTTYYTFYHVRPYLLSISSLKNSHLKRIETAAINVCV